MRDRSNKTQQLTTKDLTPCFVPVIGSFQSSAGESYGACGPLKSKFGFGSPAWCRFPPAITFWDFISPCRVEPCLVPLPIFLASGTPCCSWQRSVASYCGRAWCFILLLSSARVRLAQAGTPGRDAGCRGRARSPRNPQMAGCLETVADCHDGSDCAFLRATLGGSDSKR